MKRDARILALLTLLFATFGCGSRQKTPNVTAFAHMKYSPNHLIHYPDKTTIRHCGDFSEELRRAITMWGEAIGRSYEFQTDCLEPMIRVYRHTTKKAQRLCKDRTEIALAFTYVSPMLLVECKEDPYWHGFPLILHETGHLFGMGDTYGDWEHNDLNTYSRDVAESGISVMMVPIDKLTADDIIGMRELETGKRRFDSSSGLKEYRATGDQAKELIDSLKSFVPTMDPMAQPEANAGAPVLRGSKDHRLVSCESDTRCWVWSQEPDRLARFELDSAASERLYKILWAIRGTITNGYFDRTPPNQQTYGTDLDVHDIQCEYASPGTDGHGYRCSATFTTN